MALSIDPIGVLQFNLLPKKIRSVLQVANGHILWAQSVFNENKEDNKAIHDSSSLNSLLGAINLLFHKAQPPISVPHPAQEIRGFKGRPLYLCVRASACVCVHVFTQQPLDNSVPHQTSRERSQ